MGTSLYAAIIGVDGSGKSTCFRKVLRLLSESHTVAGIGDKVYLAGKTTGITEFDKVRWATVKEWFRSAAKRVRNPLVYETAKLTELMCWARIQKELREEVAPQIILGDGAPLVNIAGWGIHYHPRLFERCQCLNAMYYLSGKRTIPISQAYFYLRNIPEVFVLNVLGLACFPAPNITFFLHVTPETAIERISARGEKMQVHETIDFLRKLQSAYELICDILRSDFGRQTCQISVDALSPDETAHLIVEQIENAMKKHE